MALLPNSQFHFEDIYNKTCLIVGVFEIIRRFWNIYIETYGRTILFAYETRRENNFTNHAVKKRKSSIMIYVKKKKIHR